VGVEPLDELVGLVAQVRADGELLLERGGDGAGAVAGGAPGRGDAERGRHRDREREARSEGDCWAAQGGTTR
ncbi:MAG TPA: hypothetical protein DCZ69_02495, partial [Syntrophobacteraceae bacterium]|nr:hypothetical protein [Syntrophobacteraceae bacterium]